MPMTAQEVADKWQRRASAATQDMQRGVDDVKTAPGQLAAAKQQKLVNNWLESVNSGRWANKVSAVTLADWKQSMKDKAIPRYSTGVQQAVPKMVAFMNKLLPYQNSLQSTVQSMPDLTIDDSIARMTTWVRGMAQFKNT